MLVLSRKRGEGLVIGNGIQVTVLEMRGNQVKLGFVAPANVPIHAQGNPGGRKGSRPVLMARLVKNTS